MNESVDRLDNLLQRHSVALVSLLVALSSLSYNTWRNELTEANRNLRTAGFEMLLHIGELQRITFLAHYDQDRIAGNPRLGWTEVMVLQDLAAIMPAPVAAATDRLQRVWAAQWEQLGQQQGATAPVDEAIDAVRAAVLESLRRLD